MEHSFLITLKSLGLAGLPSVLGVFLIYNAKNDLHQFVGISLVIFGITITCFLVNNLLKNDENIRRFG